MSDEMLAALERLAALPDEMAQLEPGEDDAFVRDLQALAKMKYAKGGQAFMGTYFYVLTSLGKESMRLEKKRRKEEAEEKARQHMKEQAEEKRHKADVRRSWVQFFLQALFGFASFCAGVYVQYCTRLADRLVEAVLAFLHG